MAAPNASVFFPFCKTAPLIISLKLEKLTARIPPGPLTRNKDNKSFVLRFETFLNLQIDIKK